MISNDSEIVPHIWTQFSSVPTEIKAAVFMFFLFLVMLTKKKHKNSVSFNYLGH